MAEGASELSDSKAGAAAETRSPGEEDYRAARAQFAARRAYKRALRRARNPLYFSFRSLVLLVSLVLLAAVIALALVFTLRDQRTTAGLAPVIQVVESRIEPDEADQARASEMTLAPEAQVILAAETPENLVVEGPAIPTVIITSTPVPVSVGVQAAVFGVGNDKLNIRSSPSLYESQILFRESEGKRFEVVGGPREADGFTWWRVRDPQFQVEGWAVARYLRTVADVESP